MGTHIFHLILTLIAFLLLAVSLVGWGRLTSRLLKIGFTQTDRVFHCLWLGLPTVIFLFIIWNFFFPVDYIVSILVYGTGCILFAFFYIRKHDFSLIKLPRKTGDFVFIGILVMLAAWIATRGMYKPICYDSGFYHFNSIRWMNEYAVVPGIGNLHGRLAFNHVYLLFIASLNIHPFFNNGFHLANSFLAVVLLTECFIYARNLLSKGVNINEVIPYILIIPYLIYTCFDNKFSSPSSDVGSKYFQLVIFLSFWKMLLFHPLDYNLINRSKFLIIILATAIAVKLNSLVFASVSGLILILINLHISSSGIGKVFKKLRLVLAFTILFMMIWMVRGIIQSGYPLYPSTVLGIQTSWTVPLEKVVQENKTITAKAKGVNDLYDGEDKFGWIMHWYQSRKNLGMAFLFPILISIVAFPLLFAFLILNRRRREKVCVSVFLLILIPLICALAFWFFMAPNMRFIGALLWLVPISVLSVLLFLIRKQQLQILSILLVGISITALVVYWSIHHPNALNYYSKVGWTPPPTVKMSLKSTDSSLQIWVPVDNKKCWDSKIPSTPKFIFNRKLRLRGDDIQSGFTAQTAGEDKND